MIFLLRPLQKTRWTLYFDSLHGSGHGFARCDLSSGGYRVAQIFAKDKADGQLIRRGGVTVNVLELNLALDERYPALISDERRQVREEAGP